MFARILASGHFNADRVVGIGAGGSTRISDDLLVKILMRADNRLYAQGVGFVHNIFWVPLAEFTGNVFLSPEVLGFFAQQTAIGDDRAAGYWKLEELISDLLSMGFEEIEIRSAAKQLISRKLLAYDGEETQDPSDEDLIKITPSGFIHLRSMPQFVEYISSIALYAPIRDLAAARRIASQWGRAGAGSDLSFTRKHGVASDFTDYLVREKARLDGLNPLFKERSREAERLLRDMTRTINLARPTLAGDARAHPRKRNRHSAAGRTEKR